MVSGKDSTAPLRTGRRNRLRRRNRAGRCRLVRRAAGHTLTSEERAE